MHRGQKPPSYWTTQTAENNRKQVSLKQILPWLIENVLSTLALFVKVELSWPPGKALHFNYPHRKSSRTFSRCIRDADVLNLAA